MKLVHHLLSHAALPLALAITLTLAAASTGAHAQAGNATDHAVISKAGVPIKRRAAPAASHVARPGIGQSRSGVGTAVGQSGINASVGYGDANKPTGMNGAPLGQQAPTGVDGASLGGPGHSGGYGGGYGHHPGEGYGGNTSYSNGSGMSQGRNGSAPGMAGNGPHFDNGGSAGVSEGKTVDNYDDTHNPDGGAKPKGDSSSSGGFHPIDSLFGALSGKSSGDAKGGKPDAGSGSSGPSGAEGMDPNKTYKVTDPNAHHRTGSKMTADMGYTSNGGSYVNGNGNTAQPGHHTGSDAGGGQGRDGGTSSGGGRNAQGKAYSSPYAGQDASGKPREKGVISAAAMQKGNIDPKRGGAIHH